MKKQQEESANSTSDQNSQMSILDGRNIPIELVFGFVGPTGVDLDRVSDALEAQLKIAGYKVEKISLSDIIAEYFGLPTFQSYFDRIVTLQDRGNELRSKGHKEIIATMAMMEIRVRRAIHSSSSNTAPNSGVAYLVRSFKRPEEVNLFRDIYGKAFTLISVYATKTARHRSVTVKCRSNATAERSAEELAQNLLRKDYKEEHKPHGQRVGKTFPMADYFVTTESSQKLEWHIRRLVRLTFGDPYISPTRDEQSMFFAQSAALRSLDLSRQVGAAIVCNDGDLVSTGCNDVPKAGGGLYWEEDERRDRDHERGFDSNAAIKSELLGDTVRRLRMGGFLTDTASSKSDEAVIHELLTNTNAEFKESKFFDVIEFGRAVHAEMAALTQAARHGRPLQGARLFCTTFPCHICARHIVSAGLKEVIYIEPYEKSRTEELYSDSISIEPTVDSNDIVNFRSFVGVAPRRYMHFFELLGDRKKEDGRVLGVSEIAAKPKIRRNSLAYLFVEAMLEAELGKWLQEPNRSEGNG